MGEVLGGPARLRWGEPAGGDQVFFSDESDAGSGGGSGGEEAAVARRGRADGGQEMMSKAQHRDGAPPRRGRDARTAGEVLSAGQVGLQGGHGDRLAPRRLWFGGRPNWRWTTNGRLVFVSGAKMAAGGGGCGGGGGLGKREGRGSRSGKRLLGSSYRWWAVHSSGQHKTLGELAMYH